MVVQAAAITNLEQKRQVYLSRAQAFFDSVQMWLPNDLSTNITFNNRVIHWVVFYHHFAIYG